LSRPPADLGPLNFTGRATAEAGPAERPRGGFVLACLALAAVALLASVIVYAARRAEPPAVAAIAPLQGVSAPAEPAPAPSPNTDPAPGPKPAAVSRQAAAPRAAPARPAEPALTPAQARFVAALRAAPGVLTLKVEKDPEAEASARLLAALFRRAGWSVQSVETFGAGEPMRGFAAALGDSAEDEAVRQAFAGAGIRLPPPEGAAGVVRTPELYVGAPRRP